VFTITVRLSFHQYAEPERQECVTARNDNPGRATLACSAHSPCVPTQTTCGCSSSLSLSTPLYLHFLFRPGREFSSRTSSTIMHQLIPVKETSSAHTHDSNVTPRWCSFYPNWTIHPICFVSFVFLCLNEATWSLFPFCSCHDEEFPSIRQFMFHVRKIMLIAQCTLHPCLDASYCFCQRNLSKAYVTFLHICWDFLNLSFNRNSYSF
jgi:hypothetical protein